MYATILKLLKEALGELHPLVKKMQAKIKNATKKDKDDKVIDFPKTDLEVVDTTIKFRALDELDLERANKNQLKDFEQELEKVIDLGPDKLSKLPVDQQGNLFRNVKRFQRKLLQDPESKEGIASLERPEAPVLKIESGEQLTGQGLESLQKKRLAKNLLQILIWSKFNEYHGISYNLYNNLVDCIFCNFTN